MKSTIDESRIGLSPGVFRKSEGMWVRNGVEESDPELSYQSIGYVLHTTFDRLAEIRNECEDWTASQGFEVDPDMFFDLDVPVNVNPDDRLGSMVHYEEDMYVVMGVISIVDVPELGRKIIRYVVERIAEIQLKGFSEVSDSWDDKFQRYQQEIFKRW